MPYVLCQSRAKTDLDVLVLDVLITRFSYASQEDEGPVVQTSIIYYLFRIIDKFTKTFNIIINTF